MFIIKKQSAVKIFLHECVCAGACVCVSVCVCVEVYVFFLLPSVLFN